MIKQTILTLLSIGLLSVTTLAESTLPDSNSSENNSTDVNITEIFDVNTGKCIGCHGENFEKPAMGISKIVKEMTKEYIEATLFNYKYESNDGNMDALMAWQTSRLSDDEIIAIAHKIGL